MPSSCCRESDVSVRFGVTNSNLSIYIPVFLPLTKCFSITCICTCFFLFIVFICLILFERNSFRGLSAFLGYNYFHIPWVYSSLASLRYFPAFIFFQSPSEIFTEKFSWLGLHILTEFQNLEGCFSILRISFWFVYIRVVYPIHKLSAFLFRCFYLLYVFWDNSLLPLIDFIFMSVPVQTIFAILSCLFEHWCNCVFGCYCYKISFLFQIFFTQSYSRYFTWKTIYLLFTLFTVGLLPSLSLRTIVRL